MLAKLTWLNTSYREQRREQRGEQRGQNYFLPPDTSVDNLNFPADDHGNHPAYFEVLGFDNEEVDKVIENLRTLRAKDREALEKKGSKIPPAN